MAETPPPEEPARAWGADRLERADDRERVLLCPREKAWTPRRERTLTRPEHPGTAVSWGGAIFEVRAAEPLKGAGAGNAGGIRYRLAPWEERHAIRRMEAYDAASEAAREDDRAGRRASVRARKLSILLAPLAGLLPGRVQQRMEGDFGAPAVAMTVSSAAPLFLAGFLGVFDRFLGGVGGGLDLPAWLTAAAPVALYLFAESSLRLASALAMGQPMGSLPVVLAWEAWEALKEGSRPRAPTPAAAPADPGAAERDASDRFQMLEPLLSLLTPAEQSLLAGRFGFDPIRWGRITAGILLAVGALNALASLANAAGGRFGAGDALWLLAGGALALEQAARWRRLAAGAPAGSVLGMLVRPLARPLLGPRHGGSG